MLTLFHFEDQPDSRVVLEMSFALTDKNGNLPTRHPDEAYLVLYNSRTTIKKEPLAGSVVGTLNFNITNEEAGVLRHGRYNVVVVYDNVATRYIEDDAQFLVVGDDA